MINKKMESEIEGFVSRVLKGRDAMPQETAILPDVLRILKHLPEHDEAIERKITEFAKYVLKEAEESKKKEKKQVCINPDSMIGKEIKYQTALLHEILYELRNRG